MFCNDDGLEVYSAYTKYVLEVKFQHNRKAMYSEELTSIDHLFSFNPQTKMNEFNILHYVSAKKNKKTFVSEEPKLCC